MTYVIMGVSGCGKTTVGKALAERVGARFVDADDCHPETNIAKMRSGIPLTDDDRRPWFEALIKVLRDGAASGESVISACSALKRKYRELLIDGCGENIRFVYLKCGPDVITQRLAQRSNHFMPLSLVDSQFNDLEEPGGGEALIVDGGMGVDRIVEEIISQYQLGISKNLRTHAPERPHDSRDAAQGRVYSDF